MDDLFGPLMVVGVLAVIIFGLVTSWVMAKKRRQALLEVAATMGFEFLENHVGLPGEIGRFHLGNRGRAKRAYNVMQGVANNIRTVIFDYRFTTGHGKNAHTHRQTVCLLQSDTLKLPHFELRPESIFHKIGGAFGYKDIDFADYPEFSKKFLLKGEDEEAVRSLFTASVLTLLEQKDKISVEGVDQRLIFFRHGRKVKPQEIQNFLREAFEVLTVMRVR